jgi:hypothetical protein
MAASEFALEAVSGADCGAEAVDCGVSDFADRACGGGFNAGAEAGGNSVAGFRTVPQAQAAARTEDKAAIRKWRLVNCIENADVPGDELTPKSY